MSVFEEILLRLPYAKVITVSKSTKQKLVSNGVPEEKIEVVYNGIDTEKYDEIKVEKSDRPRITYIGRLVGYKNVDDLIRTLPRLKVDTELYIIGEGPMKIELQTLTRSLGVRDRVVFTGFVSEEEKIKLLKSSHVLVLPSSTEGFGISLIEAMAARTPVIASDIPALREVVGGGKAGLLFKLRDVDDLADKLERLLSSKQLQHELSRRGYRRVKEKFNWDKIAKRVEKILQTCSVPR